MKKFFREFKAFISRGNVMDLAIGVIIGGAFSAIVSSLVADIIMPLVVYVFPVQNLADMAIVLREATEELEALTWNYGAFIQSIITFVLTALVVFVLLKAIMAAKGAVEPKYGVNITKAEYKAYRKQGKTKAEIAAIDAEITAQKKAEADRKAAEAAANSTEALLKDIKEILQNK